MKAKTLNYYESCKHCKSTKKKTTSKLCAKCAHVISHNKRLIKKIGRVNIISLGSFLDKIKRQAMYIDLQDMNNIIFFYEAIGKDIHTYNNLKSGKQIKVMYDTINDFYSKKVKEKNYEN